MTAESTRPRAKPVSPTSSFVATRSAGLVTRWPAHRFRERPQRAAWQLLFVMEADGSEPTLLETRGAAYAGGGAFEPVWSPDG